MIRLLSFKDQITEGENNFAFFDTISNKILSFGLDEQQVFDSKDEFLEAITEFNKSDYPIIRFTSLIDDRPIAKMNKEDFWDKMKIKYPEAMDNFCVWIDEYKKANDWVNIFDRTNCIGEQPAHCNVVPPKFHDLPTAMQVGIFIEYAFEMHGEICFEINANSGDSFTFTACEQIIEILQMQQPIYFARKYK